MNIRNTDPEFVGIFDRFAYGEVVNEPGAELDAPVRYLAILASLIGCGGVDLRQREMITFCFIMAQGGCEPQLVAHAKGNMNLGNDSDFLKRVVSQCVPYIGYPRSLNAIACVDKAAQA